jgi:hypothetical protein
LCFMKYFNCIVIIMLVFLIKFLDMYSNDREIELNK